MFSAEHCKTLVHQTLMMTLILSFSEYTFSPRAMAHGLRHCKHNESDIRLVDNR